MKVALLSDEEAAVAEAYVRSLRERERQQLIHDRYQQTSIWNGINYPTAAWIHRGRVLGLLPYDASPDSAEQTHQTITRAGSVA